jgi:bacterioferritin-associated ferredoxin
MPVLYVCLCNGMTSHDVQRALSDGAGRPHDVYSACGHVAQCGACTPMILGLVRSYLPAPEVVDEAA